MVQEASGYRAALCSFCWRDAGEAHVHRMLKQSGHSDDCSDNQIKRLRDTRVRFTDISFTSVHLEAIIGRRKMVFCFEEKSFSIVSNGENQNCFWGRKLFTRSRNS